jgi:hypothetical protein
MPRPARYACVLFLLSASYLMSGVMPPFYVAGQGAVCPAGQLCFDSTLNPDPSFTVDYNGFVGSSSAVIPGLSAQVTFTNFNFQPATIAIVSQNGNGKKSQSSTSTIQTTKISFDFTLKNTSTAPIDASRVSGMAFRTSPDILTNVNHSVTGVFGVVNLSSNYPNAIGTVDFCFVDSSNSCAGGSSGGVQKGQSGNGTATLYYAANTNLLKFDDLFVRYQSIDSSTLRLAGASATGAASISVVPEPGFYGALSLGLAGVLTAAHRRRSRG